MDMINVPSDHIWHVTIGTDKSGEIGKQLGFNFFSYPRSSVFGAKNAVHENLRKRLSHRTILRSGAKLSRPFRPQELQRLS